MGVGVLLVRPPVGLIAGRQVGGADDQEVLRIARLGRLREVERAGETVNRVRSRL